MSSVESLMGSLSPEPDHSDGDDDSPVPVPAPVLNPNAPIDFTKISLEIFIQMIVNKMGLGPLFVEELCAFLATASFMDDNIKRVEIFKLAVQLRTYQSLIQSQGVYKNIQSTLDHVDRSIDHAAAGFTEAQIIEVRSACRVIVWDASRTDYTNPAVVQATLAYLRKYRHINSLKDYFETPTQKQASMVKRLASGQASYVKGMYRNLIKLGVLGDGKTAPTSLTDNLLAGMQQFARATDTATVSLAIHLLIARAVARENIHLLVTKSAAKIGNSDPVISDNPSATSAPASPAPSSSNRLFKPLPKLTGTASQGKDFLTRLTIFYAEKEIEWGEDLTTSGWTDFIDRAIKEEERLHPRDTMPLIPRRSIPGAVVGAPAASSVPEVSMLPGAGVVQSFGTSRLDINGLLNFEDSSASSSMAASAGNSISSYHMGANWFQSGI